MGQVSEQGSERAETEPRQRQKQMEVRGDRELRKLEAGRCREHSCSFLSSHSSFVQAAAGEGALHLVRYWSDGRCEQGIAEPVASGAQDGSQTKTAPNDENANSTPFKPKGPQATRAGRSLGLGCFVTLSDAMVDVPAEMQHLKELLKSRRRIYVVEEKTTDAGMDVLVLARVDGSERVCCSSDFRGLRMVSAADVSVSSPGIELDLTGLGPAGLKAQSEPFEACGWRWAVRATCAVEERDLACTSKGYRTTKDADGSGRGAAGTFTTITMMPEYSGASLEELRAGDYMARRRRPGLPPAPPDAAAGGHQDGQVRSVLDGARHRAL